MARASRFEDLIAWQKVRELARAVYRVTNDGAVAKDYGPSGQLQRAAVSVMGEHRQGLVRGGAVASVHRA